MGLRKHWPQKGILTQLLKWPLGAHISECLVWVPSLLPIQLPVNASGEAAEHGSSAWVLIHIHVGDPDGVWGFCLWSGPTLAIEDLVRKPAVGRSLCALKLVFTLLRKKNQRNVSGSVTWYTGESFVFRLRSVFKFLCVHFKLNGLEVHKLLVPFFPLCMSLRGPKSIESSNIVVVPQEVSSHCQMPMLLTRNGRIPRPGFPWNCCPFINHVHRLLPCPVKCSVEMHSRMFVFRAWEKKTDFMGKKSAGAWNIHLNMNSLCVPNTC